MDRGRDLHRTDAEPNENARAPGGGGHDGAGRLAVGAAPDVRVSHLQLLVQAGQVLGSSLDFHETLQHAASSIVPHMADLCVVDLLDEERQRVQMVAVGHVDPAKAERARQLRERYPVGLGSTEAIDGVGAVIRTGQPALVPIVTKARLESYARDMDHLRLLEHVGLRSIIITPLVARGTTIGALMLVWSETDRHYDESDLRFAEEFAHRAALAVDNARLYQRTQELNATLERRVTEKARQVWQLATEVTSAEMRERGRIARLLHDDLQQQLHALQFQVADLHQHVRDGAFEDFEETYAELVQGLKTAAGTTRTLTGELSPMILHAEEFSSALRWLSERFHDQHDLRVHVDAPDGVQFPNEALRGLLFSLVRECLFNVVKHAGVDEARIVLRHLEERVELEVSDEGAGFDPTLLEDSASTATGFGLRSAAQRVQLFDGELRIDSQRERAGTRITVSLPAEALFIGG